MNIIIRLMVCWHVDSLQCCHGNHVMREFKYFKFVSVSNNWVPM